MEDPIKPTTETDRPNLSTEHQQQGDARRPSDQLDKGQPERRDRTAEIVAALTRRTKGQAPLRRETRWCSSAIRPSPILVKFAAERPAPYRLRR